jgi:predicted ATPase/class 3 adenylate cyclase
MAVATASQAAQTSPAPASSHLDKYIPAALLNKLEAARDGSKNQETAVLGERRIVTMLFCDIQGSTEAAGKLDPEEWHEIINGAFEHMIAPIYRYEGTIARMMGDGILAFFGAPIAHEDDPQRAVLASLEILEGIGSYREQIKRDWGMDVNIRIGINTGLVVVGEVGSDLRMEYTAMGDAINVAARMEQTAVPGTIQLTEDTHRLIAPIFDFEDLGEIDVKGKQEPVQTYRVLGIKTQPGQIRGIEGLDAPLIGRDAEMHTLNGVIRGLKEGRGQFVSIIGEAGLGKSRLVAELHHSVFPTRATESNFLWIEGRSLSYETATPYAPFVDLFYQHFDLDITLRDAEKYAHILECVSKVASDKVKDIAPYLASLLEIQPGGEDAERIRYLDPPQLRQKVFSAVCDYFEILAARNPTVMVLDDVHWIDPTSLNLLEQILPLIDRVPFVIIALFRPRRDEPSWQLHETIAREFAHRYITITLGPLGPDRSRELVANLLEVDDLPQKVRTLIMEKAEGNPFYVEEVIRSLLDSGSIVRDNGHWQATRDIEDISVPNTLSAVITTRLDQLEEETRQVAQTASVIGRQFPYTILETVHSNKDPLDRTLTDLQRRELIREKSRLPQRQYIFKHALTQETVYTSLLLKKRRELHTLVAECLEKFEPERVNEIARHYLEARKYAQALPFLVEAGSRAAHVYSTEEAIGFFTQAIELLDRVEPDIALARRAFEGLGGALEFAYEFPRAAETYRKMIEFGEAHDEVPIVVSGKNKLAKAVGFGMADFQEALALLNDAALMANDAEDLPGLAEGSMIQCAFCTAQADFDGAVNHLSKAVTIGRKLDLDEPRLYGLTHIANTYTFMGLFDEAWETAQEAKDLAIKIGNRQYLAELLTFAIPFYHLRNGDLESARGAAEDGIEIARQIGSIPSDATGNYVLGYLAQLQGTYEKAFAYYQKALDRLKGGNIPYMEAVILCLMGTVYLDIGSELKEQTLQYHDQAEQILAQPAGTVMGAAAWAELGYCALVINDIDRAKSLFHQGLTIPTAMMHLSRPQLLIGSAYVGIVEQRFEESLKHMLEADAFVEERQMKHLAPLVYLATGKVFLAQGKTDEALEQFARSEAFASGMEMRPLVWQAQAEAAKVLSKTDKETEARKKQNQALDTIEEIEELFEDQSLREIFAAHARRGLV